MPPVALIGSRHKRPVPVHWIVYYQGVLMKPDFWHNRWNTNQIGFHLNEVNPCLIHYWPGLKLPEGARVFVPLCGKSLDMIWLLEQGYAVTGVEISRIAIESFFTENGITPNIEQEKKFTRWSFDNLELICGDFFDLEKTELGTLTGIYDRAALIAMTPAMRPRYAAQLSRLTGEDARGLLVTLEYNQLEMAGPPFSVSGEEVARLFRNRYATKRLASIDILEASPKFRDKGLSLLAEHIYRLERS